MIGLSILAFIVVLGVLVIVHELGHFCLARLFKVGVDEFGVGFPPRITGVKHGETLYSINWIPIGGFVKIKGIVGGDQMDSPIDNPPSSKAAKSFSDKPIWQRFIILFGGIGMNLILAVTLFSVGYMIGMPSALYKVPESATITDRAVVVLDFVPEAKADENGLSVGDTIREINGVSINSAEDLQSTFQDLEKAEVVEVVVERNQDEIITVEVETIELDNGKYGMGAYFSEAGIMKLPWYSAIGYATVQTYYLTKTILAALVGIIISLFASGEVSSNLAGPLGIASLTHQATQLGLVYLIQFAAILSINLAIFNLLPFPALDGGRILFLVYEVIARRPVNRRVEAVIHNLGFIILLLIILAVTIKDAFSFF